ncbi:MAG: flagellar motor stator protein MotA [Rhodospirillales bacterium]|nr:flagellar motor stator protein MotA [Rhodospirillales bacterium]MDG4577279.1 flagellar motor stator protein MotA [Defluviicoccus sp.]HOT83257.1 flagellar motor stator protein MotA [Candidatus Defluviicoccus seviourii]MDG4593582.1 flagellar motor stator protein MotA [Defluviicoccus sp.]MDG4602348.1 flagellar motor stator protein MotA [Defluviicoccus sp.]
MLFAVGMLVVLGSVVGGYLAAGGHLGVLFQPFEFIIIFGSAIGAFIVGNPMEVLVGTAKSFGKLLTGSKHGKASYVELLSVLYSVFKIARSKGDLALESHVDRPGESPVFQKYPGFLKNHHAVEFLCDYLRLLTLGSSKSHELEAVMDVELDSHRHGHHAIAGALQNVADGLPALGIVAAVLGVIHTMGAITEPPEVLGHLIGAALVGTFTGVLAAYGVVSPIARSLEAKFEEETHFLECIKIGLVAHTQGYAPQVSIELARKTLHGKLRPSFAEMDQAIQNIQV